MLREVSKGPRRFLCRIAGDTDLGISTTCLLEICLTIGLGMRRPNAEFRNEARLKQPHPQCQGGRGISDNAALERLQLEVPSCERGVARDGNLLVIVIKG